nr:E3l protein [Lemur mastadenovirus]
MSLSTFRRYRKCYSKMSLISREESDEPTPHCRLQQLFLSYFGRRLSAPIKSLMKLIFLMSVISLLHAYPVDVDYSGSGSGDGTDEDYGSGLVRPPLEDDEDAFDPEGGYEVYFRQPGQDVTLFCFDPHGDVEVFVWYKEEEMIALIQAGDPQFDLVHPNFSVPYHDETTSFLDIEKFDPSYEAEYRCQMEYSTDKNATTQTFYIFNADALLQYLDSETFVDEQKDQVDTDSHPSSTPVVGVVMAIIGIAFVVACTFMIAEHRRKITIRKRSPRVIYTACLVMVCVQLASAQTSHQYGFLGQPGKIICRSHLSAPVHEYKLYKNYGTQLKSLGYVDNGHVKIYPHSRASSFQVDKSSNSFTVTINSLSEIDAGVYQCIYDFKEDTVSKIKTNFVNLTLLQPTTAPLPQSHLSNSEDISENQLFIIIGLLSFIIVLLFLYILFSHVGRRHDYTPTTNPSKSSSKLPLWCILCVACCPLTSGENFPIDNSVQFGYYGKPANITCYFQWYNNRELNRPVHEYIVSKVNGKNFKQVARYAYDVATAEDGYKMIVNVHNKSAVLCIEQVYEDDSGEYYCTFYRALSKRQYRTLGYYVQFAIYPHSKPQIRAKSKTYNYSASIYIRAVTSTASCFFSEENVKTKLFIVIGVLGFLIVLLILYIIFSKLVRKNEIYYTTTPNPASKKLSSWCVICLICCILPMEVDSYSYEYQLGKEGQPSTLTCYFKWEDLEAYKVQKYALYKETENGPICFGYESPEMKIRGDTTNYNFTVNKAEKTFSLYIKNTKLNDAGTYECSYVLYPEKNSKNQFVTYKYFSNFQVIPKTVPTTTLSPTTLKPEARIALPTSSTSSFSLTLNLWITIGILCFITTVLILMTIVKYCQVSNSNCHLSKSPKTSWLAICLVCCVLPTSFGQSYLTVTDNIATQVGFEGEYSEITCRLPVADNRRVSAYFIKKENNDSVTCWGHHKDCSVDFHIDHVGQAITLHIKNTTLLDGGIYQCTFVFYHSNKTHRYYFDWVNFEVLPERPTTTVTEPTVNTEDATSADNILHTLETTSDAVKLEPRILTGKPEPTTNLHWILIGLLMGGLVVGVMIRTFKHFKNKHSDSVCHSSSNVAKMPLLLAMCFVVCSVYAPVGAQKSVYALDGETNFLHCFYKNMSFYPAFPNFAYLLKNGTILASYNTSETNVTKARFTTSPFIYPYCPKNSDTPYCYYMFTKPNITDSGNYTCFFKGPNGQNGSYDITYTVQPANEILSVAEGDHLFLRCGYRHLPIKSSSWYHNNSAVYPNGTTMLLQGSKHTFEKRHYLFIGTVRPTNAGNYTCSLNITNGRTVYASVNITFTVKVFSKIHLPQLPQKHISHPHNHTHRSPPLIDISNTSFIVIVVIIAIFILALAIICLIWYFWVWRKTLHIMDQPRNAYRRAPSPTAGLNMPLMCIMICGCLLQPVSANLTSPYQSSDLVLALSVVGVILTVTIVLLAALNLAARRNGDGGDRNSSDSEPEYYDSDPDYDPDDPYFKSL